MKKVLSIALSLVLVISSFAFSFSANASETDIQSVYITKDGSLTWAMVEEANGYIIYLNGVEYKTAITYMDLYEKATAQSLDCGDYTFSIFAAKDWNPISSEYSSTYSFHDFKNGEEIVEATCQTEGITRYTCTKCHLQRDFNEGYADHNWITVIKKATPSTDGKMETKCSVCGDEESTYIIYRPISFKLSKSSYTYNGKAKKPTVKIKNADDETIDNGYTVKYSNNTKVGTATAKVVFKSNYYEGTKKLTFKINPEGTSITKLSKTRSSLTVNWKKQTTQTSGYQIKIATDSKFKKDVKTITVSGNKNTRKTIKNIKRNKKYYVKVRTYKTVSGKKYYSSWSKTKSK